MPKIHGMMDIGKRAMMNSQAALQTTSHNIANKSTEGYSRQRVELMTNVPVSAGKFQVGTGNRASSITRTNNTYLEKQIQNEQGKMGFFRGRADGMGRVEQVFNEQINKGLNQYITDFFNAFRELSNNPESTTSRTMVKEAADALSFDFQRVHDSLSDIQKDIDEQVKVGVVEVNKMISEVARLNQEIAEVEVQGIPANDQRDRRDLLLKQLNEKIDIKYAEGTNGIVTVSTAGNALLVSGYDAHELTTVRNRESNRIDIMFTANESTPPFQITDRIKGGAIGGSLEIRDKFITDLKDKVDTIAYTIAQEVNEVHRQGFDLDGQPGINFFDVPPTTKDAALEIALNDAINQDVNKISAGIKPNAPGDNTVANVISQIQHRQIFDGGKATVDDFYNSQVGRVGAIAQRAIKSEESQKNILNQLSNIRESISGVSLDEETTKMIEFQRAFDASARVIKAADEMFDTVLSLKRI